MKSPLSTIIIFAILGCVVMARETPRPSDRLNIHNKRFQHFPHEFVMPKQLSVAAYGSSQSPAAYRPTLYSAGPTTYKPKVDVVLPYAAMYLDLHPDITEEQLEEEVRQQFPAKRNLPQFNTFFGDYIDLIRL